MNLRSIDLNLLVLLDALLDEAHVSRAAERVGLSQPAMSSGLERCRALFRDPLLERAGSRMRLTPKAESLRAPVKAVLAGVTQVIDPPDIPLAELRQTVRLVLSDYPATVIAGPLHKRLSVEAPGLDVIIEPWHGSAAALERLAVGGADLAVSVFPPAGPLVHLETLFRERYLVLMRAGHPAAGDFDLESWLAYPHVLVSGRGESRSPVDDVLEARGRRRRVGLVVPGFRMVPPLVAQSDLIALVPSRCLMGRMEERFHVFEPPVAVESFPVQMAWHARREGDKAVQYVAQLVRELLAPYTVKPLRRMGEGT